MVVKNPWEPVARAVLEELDAVRDQRLKAFAPALKTFLEQMLNSPTPDDWRDRLDDFLEDTRSGGLRIAERSFVDIEKLIERRVAARDAMLAKRVVVVTKSPEIARPADHATPLAPRVPSAPAEASPPAPLSTRPANAAGINPDDYTAATQRLIQILGPDWTNVSTNSMSRVRAAGALIDQHTGAALGHGANSLAVEAFVRLERKDGGADTAHFRFVWPWFSGPPHWELVELSRGAAPEKQAAALAAQQKIRHADVMRVRGAINRFQGGMFAIVGGIGGIAEGAPLLGTLEAAGGAEQVALSGVDLATGQENRAWSARFIQAALERAGVDPETARFLADNGGLLLALGRATVDAAGTAHAVIETSTGYRIHLQFDPATLSANGLGGAKIKATKITPAVRKVDTGAATHDHHTIPKEIQNKLPEELQLDRDIQGRKGLPNRRAVDADRHLSEVHDKTGISRKKTGIAGGRYNLRFQEEIEKLGGYDAVTNEQILEIRDRLVKEFDL